MQDLVSSAPVSPAAPPDSSGVNGSVSVANKVGRLKKFLAFAGPGYLISVGYMDPGNWATDLAGGARFGYALVWVILASNLMAMLLQTLCARLGIATGKDLARACRDYYSKPVAIALWLGCEVAIIACDLAEVIGSAVALKLLFGLDLMWGVLITGFDVLILLGALRFGFRKLEAIVITLVATIAFCFAMQIFFARPDWGGVVRGALVPQLPASPPGTPLRDTALYLAIGILGATVMPHNLYLHSSIVQTRAHGETPAAKREAVAYNTLDTIIALGLAFFVNAAILVVAAAVFHARGRFEVAELEQAYQLLGPSVAAPIASTLFAVALLASGQSSTLTGTLAGQIVMEGFLDIRVKPWLRRLVTRSLAIIPAMLMIRATGGQQTTNLLVFSQIVLSMQLPFAVFPLVMFTSDPKKMGEFASPLPLKILGYAVATLIASLNAYLLFQTARSLLGGG